MLYDTSSTSLTRTVMPVTLGSRLGTNRVTRYLRTSPRCLILPVPVVFLLLAFTDQPKLLILAEGKPQGAQTFFWMWKATLPHLLHRVWVLFRLFPKELVPLVMTMDLSSEINDHVSLERC